MIYNTRPLTIGLTPVAALTAGCDRETPKPPQGLVIEESAAAAKLPKAAGPESGPVSTASLSRPTNPDADLEAELARVRAQRKLEREQAGRDQTLREALEKATGAKSRYESTVEIYYRTGGAPSSADSDPTVREARADYLEARAGLDVLAPWYLVMVPDEDPATLMRRLAREERKKLAELRELAGG